MRRTTSPEMLAKVSEGLQGTYTGKLLVVMDDTTPPDETTVVVKK